MKTIIAWGLLLAGLSGHSQTSSLNVYFGSDKYDLTNEAKITLDSLVHEAGTTTGLTIELYGHCDASASDEYNDLLSLRRATRVKNYLLSKGIQAESVVKIEAWGKKKPLNNNSNEEEKQLNRRVEIIIIHNKPAPVVTQAPVPEEENLLKEKIADSTITPGSTIRLRNINFQGGRHSIMQESYPIIRELLEVMKSYPGLVIEIQGHICCQPGAGDGIDLDTRQQNLSEARAKAIHDYLIANGIDRHRVSYKGFGHSQPLYAYPEQTEYQRLANRRVEIKIVSK